MALAFLAARSDASMHANGRSAGIAAEVLVFIDHQRYERIAHATYHFPISNIDVAELVAVLLSAVLLSSPTTALRARAFAAAEGVAPRFASAALHTDRDGLVPDCRRCSVLEALKRRIMPLYNLAADDIRVQWTRREDPWMVPMDTAARGSREKMVIPVSFSILGSVLHRNADLQVTLYRMSAAWMVRDAPARSLAVQ